MIQKPQWKCPLTFLFKVSGVFGELSCQPTFASMCLCHLQRERAHNPSYIICTRIKTWLSMESKTKVLGPERLGQFWIGEKGLQFLCLKAGVKRVRSPEGVTSIPDATLQNWIQCWAQIATLPTCHSRCLAALRERAEEGQLTPVLFKIMWPFLVILQCSAKIDSACWGREVKVALLLCAPV